MAEIDDFLAESKKSGGFFGIGGSKPVSKTSEVDEFLAQKRGEGGSNILRRAVVDPLVGVAQGTLVGLPEAAVGLANIPTLGGAGKMVENVARGIGVPTFDEANERFKSLLSPETREAERKVAEAEGFVGTLKAGLANPSAPVQTIMQSIPAMFGGAAAGRAIVTALGKAPLSGKALTEALTAAGGPSSAAGKALLKSNMAKAVTAGAVGEGLVSAGQNVEQLRQEMTSGLITPQQAMIMSGSGFATGLITKMSGGLASRLKIVDVDTLLQGVNTAGHIELKILPVLKALAWSAISEGAIEELPQSAQETFASNVAAGRPPFDGVPEAAAMGLLAGVGMGLGGGGGAVIRQYIQDQDPNNRKINQLMEEIGGEELEAVKVPGFITGSEAATVPITPGEQALPEEAMVEDQAGNMLEEELAAIEAPPLEELSGEVQAIEAAPAEVAPIGTPLEALPQIEAAPAIEAAPLQPALEAPVAPVEAPAIQEAASIAPHPEIAPAAIEAAMPPAAEAPVIPPAPQAIPAPAASVPGIPDVFMQMPMETLQQMADNGVAGAKAALPIRLQQAAAPIAPPVPPVPQQAAPAIPAAQPPVPAKAAEVSTFKRKKDFSYSGEYSFTVNGENWKAYRDADAGNLHAWFAAKEGDDFPRQSSLYSKKELIDRIESGEYYKGGPDYVPSAGTPAPAPPAPVAKSSATRKQLKEMGEDPDYLLKEIRGADDLQGVDEQNYNQAIARGESGSIEISQAESVRKLRLAEATKEISKKRKTPQAPAPAPPAAPAPPVTSAAEAKTRIAGKKVSAEAKALTGQIAQVEAALADREKKIKAGEKAKKDMSSAKKAQSVQQHYLAKIKKDLADLSAKEAAPKKTKSPVQDEIDAAEDSVKLLEKELTKAQKDYDEAVRLARPKKEIKILGNTRDDIKKEIADVKKELSRLTKKPSFTREDQAAGAGLLAERAQSIVDKVLGFLKNPPPVRVLADINTFINSDDPMGKRLKAYMVENEMLDEDGGDSRTVGFFWEGTTYIVAGNISTPQGVVNTLAHELTHNGLGRLLDSQKGMPGIGSIRLKRDILMDKIYHAHTADIKEIAATTHQHLDLSKAEGRRQAAEEWVCNQSYEAQPKWYDKLVALFHDAMRALGINTKITDAEVRVVLGDAFKEFGYRAGEPQFSRTQINTPAFKNWFGSSKVVNKNGEPLVVYHGTRTSPVKFKKIMGMFGHFGTIAAANDKLEWDAHRPGEHAVMPVYLSLQNPVRMEDVHFDEYGTMAEDLVESGALSKKDLPLAWEKRYGNLDTKYITQLIDVLKSKGYDGIVYENRVESPGEDSWIPFAATQIKSATGNVGAFAKANPDIRFARGTGFENRNYGSRVLSGEESVPGSVPPFLSDVATYLEDISKKDGRVDHRTATRKQKEQIVGAVKEMLRASVKRYPESLGWYKKDLETTMDILTDIYPELKKPSNHFRMRLAIALSSNGNDTTTNIEIARKIYESFRDSGIMESDVKASRAKAIRESLRLADILRGTFKSEKAFEDWLLGSAYIGDLQSDVAARLKITRKEAAGIVGGTEGQDTFLPRAIIFGPKVGVFFTNLSGDFSQITMDRWFMRTMGRLTGILVEGGKKSEVIAQRERFTEAMKASPGGVRLSQIQEDLYSSGRSIDKAAAKISKLSMKDNFRELLNNVPGGEELRHAANNRNKYINGAMPIDSPSSGAHRQWLRDIVNEAREGLEKEGLSYENADIQAAIWIGEKELYKTFGVKGKRGDYYSTGAEVLYERVHGRPSGRHAGIAGRVVERGRGKLGQTLPLFSRTPDNIIEKIKDLALNSPDGFTINVADGTAQTTGYAVAPSKLTETRVKKLTERNLTEFIDRYGDVFEKDTRAFLGGWHDSNTKEIVLDISFVVDDLADALYIADIGDQIAIFHLDNFEEIGREDGIKGLKEAGVYSQGRRDELGGIQESLHKAIQGSGVAGGRAGEPSFTRTAGRVRTAGQRVERKGVTRSSGQELIDQGTHYSNQQRGRLDSKFYGTGLADAASRRLPSDPKSPLRQRIHFYYDPGTGMPKAEVGVGTYAHNADLSQYKIYNLSSGKIKVDRVEGEHVLNTFEKAIMKAGFDGFSSPDYGVVVLIGKRTVPVEPQFSRISSQEDAAYLKAVESGDMEIAQKMVDEAAKAAGYNVEAWHGGAKGINEFVPSVEGMYGAGIYTGGNEDYITKEFASQGQWLYGKFVPASKVYHVYLKMDNPLTVVTPVDVVEAVDGKVAAKEMSDKHGGPYELILDGGYTRDLQKKGYDGIIADNEWGRENIVFNPNQIKSADAITYNDKGNVTPLSERFSEESPDIRFSRTEEEAARKAGAEFSGFYETPAFGNKPARKIPTYNDPETGATFALNKGETIEQGLARKRAEFKKAADRPGAETVTEPSESTAAPAISDRVLFSIAAGASVPPGNDATWNAPVKSAMSSLWYTLVDKHADLRDVTTAIEKFSGTIGDVVNASLKETLFSGRVAKRVENYLEGELRPVLKELSNKNIDLSDFEEYLHFRHAEEANDYVKTLVDDKGKVVGMQDGGSGKTYQQIKDYFAGLDKGLAGRMESVAVKVDAMTRENARLMAEYRLESQATIDKWFGTYQHYVPLFREHVSEARMGTGTGLTVTGSITRKRKGSEKSVVNVLANIANQRERVIASGEKNIIATALYGLAKMHPNAEFWRVIKPGVKKVLDLKTKEMIWTPDFDYKKKTNVVMSRQFDKDGNIVERGIEFSIENERARRMADSIRNIDMDTLGLVLGTSAKVTRFIASMNTQYNPVFGVTNFVRDVGTAMFNLTTTPIAGRQKEMMGHALPALKGIYEAIRAQRAGKPFSSEWAKLFDEFQTHGGQTGYRDLYKTTDERSRRLEREINMMKGGTALKAGSAVMGWLSDYNTAMENAIRLSAYKVGIDNGMSKDQSAAMAKSLTVNFNRKGQIATQAGSLYAFFNASAQGISKVYETLTGPAGKRVIAGGLLFGVMQAAVLAAAGMGDDEPPEFVQEKNIVIPISGGKYITIPMPLGFNVLPNIGRMSAQFAMSGFERPFDRMANLFGVILDGFNPLGASKTLLQTISPTPIDPLVALAENKDWTGKPIYREDFSSLHPTPGFTRTKDTATWGGKGLAWGLNMLTGGTRATPGFFSPTPDQIDYLFGQATGGVGRETAKLQQTAAALATGDEVPAYKIPLGSRFFGSTTGGPYEATKYYNNLKMMNQHEDEIKDLKKHREPIMEYMADNPKAKLWTLSNKTESTINKLKKRKQDMIARGAKGESIKTIDALIATHMKRFNDTIAAAK